MLLTLSLLLGSQLALAQAEPYQEGVHYFKINQAPAKNDSGKVDRAYFQAPDFKGFEKFCEGRAAEEMPALTQKICGVCPTAHHTASDGTVWRACYFIEGTRAVDFPESPAQAEATIARSSLRRGRNRPGVSTKTIWLSPSIATPRMRARVVWTLWVTMETLAPTSWFTSVDFPEPLCPTIATHSFLPRDKEISCSTSCCEAPIPVYLP